MEKCVTCKSPVYEGQERGPCVKCGEGTCIYCNRICDACLKMACWNHLTVEKVWLQGHMQLMKLCQICKESKRWVQ